jgi:REP element-mobilizing transposase RayT
MKPGSYTQLYTQLVFAFKYRNALLTKEIRPKVFGYIGGIINDLGHKTIIVNGVSDHIHIFLGLNPKVSISDTVHDIKRSSSIFIRENNLSRFKFNWQEGYGAFSYSKSHIDNVFKYIENQEQHHKKEKFRTEYIKFLDKFEIEYDERFLFDFFD